MFFLQDVLDQDFPDLPEDTFIPETFQSSSIDLQLPSFSSDVSIINTCVHVDILACTSPGTRNSPIWTLARGILSKFGIFLKMAISQNF